MLGRSTTPVAMVAAGPARDCHSEFAPFLGTDLNDVMIPCVPRPRRQKKTVLVASRDPQLADVRKRALEEAGYQVISVNSIPQIKQACQAHQVHLVVVGYSLPPAEKR